MSERELLVGRRLERHAVQRRDAVRAGSRRGAPGWSSPRGRRTPSRGAAPSARCMKRSRVTLARIDAAAIAALVGSRRRRSRAARSPTSGHARSRRRGRGTPGARRARGRREGVQVRACGARDRRSRAHSARRSRPAPRSAARPGTAPRRARSSCCLESFSGSRARGPRRTDPLEVEEHGRGRRADPPGSRARPRRRRRRTGTPRSRSKANNRRRSGRGGALASRRTRCSTGADRQGATRAQRMPMRLGGQ